MTVEKVFWNNALRDLGNIQENEIDAELTRELLKDILIKGTDKDGAQVEVKLSEIAEFTSAISMDAINRTDQTRYITVSAAIAEGYNVGKVASVVNRQLEDYPMPEGYHLVFTGENETINDKLVNEDIRESKKANKEVLTDLSFLDNL